jgi:hypothetical protein
VKRFLAAVLFFLLSVSLFAADNPPVADLVFSKKQYNVSVYVFSPRGLKSEYASLSQGFPRLLYKQIGSCRDHRFAEAEQGVIRKIILDSAVVGFYGELETLFAQRDELLFLREWQGEVYRDKTLLIKALEKKIAFFENWDSGKIDLPGSLPVVFLKPSESEPLQPWREGQFQPRLKLDDTAADLAVFGTMEQVGDILYITVSVYNFLTGEVRQVWSGTGRNEDISMLVTEAAASVRKEILGRDWAGLTVRALPDEAMLYIDGELFGIGEGSADALTPGAHQLTVAAEGYAPDSREIVINAGEYSLVEVALEKTEGFLIAVTSEPEGADVYTGSLWIGRTPLSLERPANGIQLIITAEGYNPERTRIGPGFNENQIHIDLLEGVVDFRLVYEKKRRELYTSLGWFGLSILLPVVLNGLNADYLSLTNHYADQYSMFPTSENKTLYDEAYTGFEVTRWSLYGSLVLTGGLLVNVLVKLYHFIKAAEDSAP